MTARTTDTNAYFQVFESLLTPVVLLDTDGRVWNLNPEAVKLLYATAPPDGEHEQEARRLLGQPVQTVFPWLPSSRRLLEGEAQSDKFECSVSNGGRTRFFEGRVSGLRDTNGKLTGSVILLSEVTEHKALAHRLERLARTDGLTGVYNRRHLLAVAARETLRARRYARPLSVMLIDVDHFKQVNDSLGHAAGDEVLVRLTHAMTAALRSTDALGRVGGEEFAILLPETDEAAAIAASERIRARVAEMVVGTQAGAVRLTVSIGVAALDRSDRDFSELLGRADEALYRAKARGRDLVVAAALGRPRLDAGPTASRNWESGTFPLSDEALAARARTRGS
ncbi:MAG: diguanylate cyclase [Polyangiaceae bacterium]|nr:diguanylate cyclase [Polyangiaceae bacterium]